MEEKAKDRYREEVRNNMMTLEEQRKKQILDKRQALD